MELSNKAAYLQGLVDGLGVDESTKEGKIIKAMSALLAEMAEALEGMDEDLSRAYDQINDLSDELEDLEADLYEEDEDGESEDAEDEDTDDDDDAKDDDIASEPFYEVACPNCGETVYVSEDDLDAGEANCAHCGVTFEVALEGDGEDDAEDGPVQYEVTCPECGTTSVFEEDELLDGAPKCPNCGKPLVRKDNELYYGNMTDPYVLYLQIMTTKPVGDQQVADKVHLMLLSTDTTKAPQERVMRQTTKIGLYNALDIGSIWLQKANAQ